MLLYLHAVMSSAAWKEFVKIHNGLYTAIIFIPPLLVIRYLFQQNRTNTAVKYAIACFLIILFSIGTNGTLAIVDRLTPIVYDPAIYGIEVHTLLNLPGLVKGMHSICRPVYYPLAGIYDCLLLPAVGPVYYAQGGFPGMMPDVFALQNGALFFKNKMIERNSMPSLHATWVILCFLALRQSPFKYRVLGALYVLATFIFTIGMGEHYLLDWVIALPLVLFIRALTSDYQLRGIRLASVLLGGATLIGWIEILRHVDLFINNHLFLNGLIIATMIIPIYIERRLMAAEAHLITVPRTSALPA